MPDQTASTQHVPPTWKRESALLDSTLDNAGSDPIAAADMIENHIADGHLNEEQVLRAIAFAIAGDKTLLADTAVLIYTLYWRLCVRKRNRGKLQSLLAGMVPAAIEREYGVLADEITYRIMRGELPMEALHFSIAEKLAHLTFFEEGEDLQDLALAVLGRRQPDYSRDSYTSGGNGYAHQ